MKVPIFSSVCEYHFNLFETEVRMADQFFKAGFVDVRFADGGRFCDRKPTGHVFWQSFYLTNLARRDKPAQLLSVLTRLSCTAWRAAFSASALTGCIVIYGLSRWKSFSLSPYKREKSSAVFHRPPFLRYFMRFLICHSLIPSFNRDKESAVLGSKQNN